MRPYQNQKPQSVRGEQLLVELQLSRQELGRMVEQGLRGMALEIGLEIAAALLADEVDQLCGPKGKRSEDRAIYRHGTQRGWVQVGGAKVSINRPRVRAIEGTEVELGRYRVMQHGGHDSAVMGKLVRGVSCRNYRAVIEAVVKSYGTSASSVSRSFVAASEARVRELAERRFEGTSFAAIFIDGVVFARQTLIAALGVTDRGEKMVLAVRHGASENASVCTDLLSELRERGISTTEGILFVIDGSKALRSAIRQVWGEHAQVQRCQQHKLRNVKAYVPDKHWNEVHERIRKAYAETSYARARRSLENTARWLERINPHAAASLREGLDETLTVTRLGLRGTLRRSFATTNMVESVFARARMMTGRVKRWRGGSMRLRWCATALLHGESTFHKIHGRSELDQLLVALGRPCSRLRTRAA